MPDWLGQNPVIAGGTATVLLSQNNPAVVWEVQQIGCSVGPASTSGNIVIFKNGNLVAPTAILAPQVNTAGTSSIGQTAAGLPYVYVNASDTLQIIASAVTVGDTLTVRAQYREFNSSDEEMRGR
jgi:hypothetical protein